MAVEAGEDRGSASGPSNAPLTGGPSNAPLGGLPPFRGEASPSPGFAKKRRGQNQLIHDNNFAELACD
ncbi:hypothetical protein N9L68_08375 [bacterium]|nr:hypothetical protein [bacterium]